jgi:hypothetical protein
VYELTSQFVLHQWNVLSFLVAVSFYPLCDVVRYSVANHVWVDVFSLVGRGVHKCEVLDADIEEPLS